MFRFKAVIVTAVLSCCLSSGSTFLIMETKVKDKIISLKNEIKEIKEAQTEETYNGITLKMWVKANPQYGKRVAGKVAAFKFRGEAYPIAVLRGGKEISVFWLVPMKTQRG